MNIIAILTAALIPTVLGFIWYNPKVFRSAWLQASGMTEEKANEKMALKVGLSLLFSVMIAFVLNTLVVHDAFVNGAVFYKANRTMIAEPGTELAQWQEYYKTNLAADNHIFTHGAFHGFFLVGLFLILPLFASTAVYEGKSVKYVAINAGYWMLCVALMGGLIAVWR